jgi:hypothetical protein
LVNWILTLFFFLHLFIVGDMEHTHLVKGLDYQLLEKMRKQKEQEDEEERLRQEEAAARQGGVGVGGLEAIQRVEDIESVSELGESLKRFLLVRHKEAAAAAAAGRSTSAAPVRSSVLMRSVLDFDIRPTSEVDVPMLITRSKKVKTKLN